jgi:GTP cyclohydrolase II
MKYNDLIQFEPIESVIQLLDANRPNEAMKLISPMSSPMTLELQTEFGDFFAVHLQSDFKEGLVLRPKTPSSNTEMRLRIQSSCLFSESLRTTDCDCAAQLHESVVRIGQKGGA